MNWREDLFRRRSLGVRLGLDAVRAVDQGLGGPGHGIAVAHVVGTNGKGSTCAMLSHALIRSGRRVGLYTSPHLHRVGERVRIDGEPVPDETVQCVTERVIEAESAARGSRSLTFFEVLTLGALLAFEDAGVDVMVLEAGLGGRLDATRVRDPSVTLVSRIGIDHQTHLGETLEQIAGEKAAVLARGVPCWSVHQPAAAAAVIEAAAVAVGAPLHWVERLAKAPLPGEHQRDNAALALAGARHFVPTATADLLAGVRWPGRLESVAVGTEGGELLLDVAHNLDGMTAIVEHVQARPPSLVVFGCMADKDRDGMLAALRRLGCPVWHVPPLGEGAMPMPRLDESAVARGWRAFPGPDEPRFVHDLEDELEGGARVLVCGSHFLVAHVRAHALGLSEAPDSRLRDPILRR